MPLQFSLVEATVLSDDEPILLGRAGGNRLDGVGATLWRETASELAVDAGLDVVCLKPLRIFLVDDNVDAADLLAEMLKALGHHVWVAHHPAEALSRAVGVHPDVFIPAQLQPQLCDGCVCRVSLNLQTGWGEGGTGPVNVA